MARAAALNGCAFVPPPRRRWQLHRDIEVVIGRLLEAVGLPDGSWEQALAVDHTARELVDLLESVVRERALVAEARRRLRRA